MTLFQSIGVDVIYGIPGQTTEMLGQTLETLFTTGPVSHLSLYECTVHHDTPFGWHVGIIPFPPEEAVIEMSTYGANMAAAFGLLRYEVSNYALPRFACVHNRRYWLHEPYIGLGASAHSFLFPRRWGNVRHLETYFSMLSAGKFPFEFVEELDNRNVICESIMLGLRTSDGVNEERFRRLTGEEFFSESRRSRIELYEREGLLLYRNGAWCCTPRAFLVSDGIARELMPGPDE